MNIKQNGLGVCEKHGVKVFSGPNGRTCLSCEAEKDQGHGETVIVTEPQGEKGPVNIRVITNEEAKYQQGEMPLLRKRDSSIHLDVTVEDLMSSDILIMLLTKIHSGIDDMPPPNSIKDMKKIVAIQEGIQKLIERLSKGDK